MRLLTGLRQIFGRMSPARRHQFFFVIALLLLGAIAELGTIGAVIPFLALLSSQQRLGLSGPGSGFEPLVLATGAFIAFALLAGFVRLQLAWSSRSFALHFGHELAVEIQRRVIFQPFAFHIERNSSSLMAGLNKAEILVHDVLLPLMHALTAAVIALAVTGALLFVDAFATVLAAVAFILIYALISLLTRKSLDAHSEAMKTAYDDRLRTVQESLGGIRDVIIDHAQHVYLRAFSAIDYKVSSSRAGYQFIAAAPRYLIETAGLIMIAGIALFMADRPGGIMGAIPTLGALALGAQRLLPLIQQIYAGWSSVAAHQSLYGQVLELLSLPMANEPPADVPPVKLGKAIVLRNVGFAYPTRKGLALDDINLAIPRGSMVALIGPTGSGKSTLVDVLMGLLAPTEGSVAIDDVQLSAETRPAWYRSIAHVPQSIFLIDASIERNIAFSLPNIEPVRQKVVEAARKAQLHDFIVALPAGYETAVGERGVRLSGGQRQRLGIARAIYKGAPILVFDEATSALDDATEDAVIAAVEQLRREGRTIIIVAHRQSTIRHCDMVVRLDQGRLAECRSTVGRVAKRSG